MAIDRSEIADVHTFEDILLMTDGRLDSVGQADDTIAAVVLKHTFLTKPFRHLITHLIIRLLRVQAYQVFFQAAHGAVDAHVVVVEDDEHVVGSGGDIVQSLKCQTAAHSPVADYSHT